jgi:hypothetical protein
MKRTLLAAAAAALALGGIATAAPAFAEHRCGFQGDWDCDGQPQYNGRSPATTAAPTGNTRRQRCNESSTCRENPSRGQQVDRVQATENVCE